MLSTGTSCSRHNFPPWASHSGWRARSATRSREQPPVPSPAAGRGFPALFPRQGARGGFPGQWLGFRTRQMPLQEGRDGRDPARGRSRGSSGWCWCQPSLADANPTSLMPTRPRQSPPLLGKAAAGAPWQAPSPAGKASRAERGKNQTPPNLKLLSITKKSNCSALLSSSAGHGAVRLMPMPGGERFPLHDQEFKFQLDLLTHHKRSWARKKETRYDKLRTRGWVFFFNPLPVFCKSQVTAAQLALLNKTCWRGWDFRRLV